MASIRLKPRSPYFFACYRGPDGQRVQRSTKQSNRRKAQALAEKFEKASRLALERRLGEAQARRVLSEIYEDLNNTPLPITSASDYLTKWAERRKVDTAPRTHAAYAQVVRDFLATLPDKGGRDISQLSKAEVSNYRDTVVRRTSVATANKALKYLRVALNAAFKDGVTQDNPAAKVDTLKRPAAERVERRAFTLPELKRLLEHASGEWRGLLLFGLYTGQRLRDIAGLTWSNIDTEHQQLNFVTRKTERRMSIGLAGPLVAHLASTPAPDDPAAPLFPSAFQIAVSDKPDSRLSQQFREILVAAGMAQVRTREATGLGRSRKRTVSEISYHSLRHTTTTLLKVAGVPDAVVMDIIGHDSEAVSRQYTHVGNESKQRAIEALPDITQQ